MKTFILLAVLATVALARNGEEVFAKKQEQIIQQLQDMGNLIYKTVHTLEVAQVRHAMQQTPRPSVPVVQNNNSRPVKPVDTPTKQTRVPHVGGKNPHQFGQLLKPSRPGYGREDPTERIKRQAARQWPWGPAIVEEKGKINV